VFSKFSAIWLVVLILLPFTAPFPTCDIAVFLGRGGAGQGVPLTPPTSSTALIAEAVSSFLVLPLARVAPQLEQAALSDLQTPYFAGRSPLVVLVPPVGADDHTGAERSLSAILRL
jgi:hypothetical protein